MRLLLKARCFPASEPVAREKKTRKRCTWGFVDTDRPRPNPSAPMGADSRAPLGVDYHLHHPSGGSRSFPLVTVAPSDRGLAEASHPPPPPPLNLVNPYMAKSFGWVLPPPPSQTDWVPAGPRPVAARVGVRPAGHSPAFQAQSGFVGPAGDWLGARRLVENLVSAQRGGERRAAPPPPPGGGAFICSRRLALPAWEPAHNHSLLSHLSTPKPPSHSPPATCSSPNPWRTPPPNFSPLSFPLFLPAYPSLAHTDSP